jgi:hypothetical protein
MELAEIRFAADSPLEGWREMDSNHRYRIRNNPFGYPVRSRNSPSATKTGSFVPGTHGSNPFPSSRESGVFYVKMVRRLMAPAGINGGDEAVRNGAVARRPICGASLPAPPRVLGTRLPLPKSHARGAPPRHAG